MRTRSAPPQIRPRSRRAKRRGASIRGEIVLAAVVVTVYATVVGMSLISLFGGEAVPDLLRLREKEETPASNVAQVLGAQAQATPVAPAQAATPVRTPEPATAPAETAAPRPVQESPQPVAATRRPDAQGRFAVQSGDTLSLLGVLFHVDVGALKLVNGLTSDLIYAGQTLIVPQIDSGQTISVPSLGEGGAEQWGAPER